MTSASSFSIMDLVKIKHVLSLAKENLKDYWFKFGELTGPK